MSTNNIFKTSVKYLLVALLFQFSTLTVKANEVSMGGFTGTLTTKLSTGLSVRMEDNDCRLLQGDSLAISGTMQDLSLIHI